jgi:hypothetical protein
MSLNELIEKLAEDFFGIIGEHDKIITTKEFRDHLIEYKNSVWSDIISKIDAKELEPEFAKKYLESSYLTIECNLLALRIDNIKNKIQEMKVKSKGGFLN